MNLSFLLILIFTTKLTSTSIKGETIICDYKMILWLGMDKRIYCCDVTNLEIFSNGSRIKIEDAFGEHTNGRTSNKQVYGISIWKAKNMNFIPSNLEEIFPSLILVNIFSSDLSQISSDDLKSFPKLKHLQLNMNLIEFISEDLFQHNPELEFLNLDNNIIQHIDRESFSSLNKLRSLLLNNNVCDSMGYAKNRNEVLGIIKRVQEGECQSFKYTTTTTTSENSLISILSDKDEIIENFKAEIKSFKDEMKNLKNQLKIKEMKIQEISQENQNQILNCELQIAQKDEEIFNLEKNLKQKTEKLETKIEEKVQECEIKNFQMQKNIEKLINKLDQQLENCNNDQIMAKIDKQTLDFSNLYASCDANYKKLSTENLKILSSHENFKDNLKFLTQEITKKKE